MSTVLIESQGYIFGERFKDGIKTYGFPNDALAEDFVDAFNAVPQGEDSHNNLTASLMDEPYELERHVYFEKGTAEPLILHIVVVDRESEGITMHILEALTKEEVQEYQSTGEQPSVVAAYVNPTAIAPTEENVVVSLMEDVSLETYMSFDPNIQPQIEALLKDSE